MAVLAVACAGPQQAPAQGLNPPASVAAPSAPPASLTQRKVLLAGQTLRVAWFGYLNPDCSLGGMPTVRVVEAPTNGTVRIARGLEYPNFPPSNQRYRCNLRQHMAQRVYYAPKPGFTGTDNFSIEVFLPNGTMWTRKYDLTVK